MNRPLLLILVLSALLSVGYARSTPVGGAPDEGAHLEYVKVLATEGRLPALDMTKRRSSFADPNYEAHQPPVYYGLAVPFYHAGKAVAGDTGAAQGARGLSIMFGLLGTYLIWTIARELLPNRPALWGLAAAVAAFLPMRLHVTSSVSNDSAAEATASLALLLMVRALTRTWSLRAAAWLGLAIALAFLTKQSNLMLLPPALVVLFLASRFTGMAVAAEDAEAPAPEPAGRKKAGKLGAVEPKSQRGKSKTKAEPAPMAAPATASPAEGSGLTLFFKCCLVVGAIFVVLTGWWLARNQMLYGDPLAKKAFDWYFADTPLFERFRRGGFTFGMYLERLVFPTTFATFWGAFGHLPDDKPYFFMGAYGPGAPGRRWGYPPRSWTYELLGYCVVLALAGLIAYAVQRFVKRAAQANLSAAEPTEAQRLRSEARSAALGVLGLHALFVFAVYMNFNSTYFQAQGRYLFAALGILSIALAAGWLQWGRTLGFALNRHLARDPLAWDRAAQKWERPLAWLFGAAMLALALYGLFGVLDPAFNHPPPGPESYVH